MDTTIIIPCVRRSRFLEKTTLPAIAAHTSDKVPVVVGCDPDLNVSECRQKQMDLADTRYVYFMDVDSVIEQDEWLEILMDIMDEYQAATVTPTETYNGTDMITGEPYKARGIVGPGRAVAGAGVLYDKDVGAKWDPYLGETYGYIGRELEDSDFAYCIEVACGRRCYGTDKVVYNHAWHDKSDWDSDEYAMWKIVAELIKRKWSLEPDLRDEFFRLLHPQPTTTFEKNHSLANGMTKEEAMRQIYGDLIEYWGGDTPDLPEIKTCFPMGPTGDLLTTPEQRGVKDVWSERYQEVKPRSPK